MAWRVQEAEAALPRVQEMLAECRAILSQLRGFEAHMEDLRIIGGDVLDPADQKEYQGYAMRRDEARGRLHDALGRFEDQDIQVRDLDAGIVDFLTERGDETVCLCWREGEDGIHAWHPLDAGYAGRRPLPDIPAMDV